MNTMMTVTGKVIRLSRKKPGPKPLPESVKKRRITISISPYWHDRGKELAVQRGVSLSAFLEDLVVYADSLCNESA